MSERPDPGPRPGAACEDWLGRRMAPARPGAWAILAGLLRLAALGAVTFGGLGVLLLIRLAERPLCGARRPVTPWITQGVCRAALAILGLRLRQRGRPSRSGAAVANHASWLDVFVLNACDRVYFVAKAEVAGWPGIGRLARATGTLFVARRGAEAEVQRRMVERRLLAGHRLLFFPEGTSTDGLRILPFKSTLFAAFFARPLRADATVQPVAVRYASPKGEDPRLYGWWGDMDFGPHLWRIATTPGRGRVEVVWTDPVAVKDVPDRKTLARRCEGSVRAAYAAIG